MHQIQVGTNLTKGSHSIGIWLRSKAEGDGLQEELAQRYPQIAGSQRGKSSKLLLKDLLQ